MSDEAALPHPASDAILDGMREITETDVVSDVPGPWVACEEYSTRCTGPDYAADMVALRDGTWMCPTCYREEQGDAEDQFRTARGY